MLLTCCYTCPERPKINASVPVGEPINGSVAFFFLPRFDGNGMMTGEQVNESFLLSSGVMQEKNALIIWDKMYMWPFQAYQTLNKPTQ